MLTKRRDKGLKERGRKIKGGGCRKKRSAVGRKVTSQGVV